MTDPISLDRLTRAEDVVGEDAEETRLLREMLKRAKEYIASFKWCPPFDQVYFGCGVGGVVAVFLFRFRETIANSEEWLWVVEGDLPSAYLVLDRAREPTSALEVYCELMEEWAQAVLENRSLKDVFPVKAEPTTENANDLLKRLAFIRKQVLPREQARTKEGSEQS